MPTVFTHALVALAASHVASRHVAASKPDPTRFWTLAIGCSLLPDADVVGLVLGIPYAHPLGHRGFFHSPFFGVIVGLVVTLCCFADTPRLSRPWWRYVALFGLVTASHGALDAMTNGGLGVALLAPFDNERCFLLWRPIQVSPLGLHSLFSRWGVATLTSEILWIWIPLAAVIGLALLFRTRRARRPLS